MCRTRAAPGVANAKITLLNTATGVSQETSADNSGNYRFVSLAPGSYKITAAGAGFGKTDVTVTLTTGQNLNVPMSLQLASAATTVEVTSSAPIIDTAETRNQQTIQSEELSNIPLAGRNMVNLITLAPGVTGRGLSSLGSPGSAADNFSTEQQVDASANGRSSNANMYVVDGLDVTSNIRPGVLNLTPNPDAIQESTTEVNTFSVQYGRGSSLIFNMTTKSGTDQFHGLASDYFTYENFWAGTEFNHSYLPFHSNNISANIGGPIIPSPSVLFLFRDRTVTFLTGSGQLDHFRRSSVRGIRAAEFREYARNKVADHLRTDRSCKHGRFANRRAVFWADVWNSGDGLHSMQPARNR